MKSFLAAAAIAVIASAKTENPLMAKANHGKSSPLVLASERDNSDRCYARDMWGETW